MDKQALRNELSEIEDSFRSLRHSSNIHEPREGVILALLVRLTQAVREEIVR